MPFKPGQSGNPGGTPHAREWQQCVRAAGNVEDPKKRRRLMQLAAEQLWRLAAYEGDIQALKEVGDRLDGKPHQTSTTETVNRSITEMTRDELLRIAAQGRERVVESEEETKH